MVTGKWDDNHIRYFQIGGLTIKLESDLPFTETKFNPRFEHFVANGPGLDNLMVKHHFYLPDLDSLKPDGKIYKVEPWTIYKRDDSWIYIYSYPIDNKNIINKVVIFSHDHTNVQIYNPDDRIFREGNVSSLSLLRTDQILLAKVLGDREGCYMHSSGVNLHGKGLMFLGQSGAGKSTMVMMLKKEAEILCEDRIIIRRFPEGSRIYGTWDHGGELPVSSNSAPLRAIMFLEQAKENRLIAVDDKKKITEILLTRLVRPFATPDWWRKILKFVDEIVNEVPCYTVKFDKSGQIINLLKEL